MADIPNRDILEAQIARLLGKYNRRQVAKLMELMKNSPTLANVPVEFWTESQLELVQTLMPFSEMVYLEAAARMLETVPIGVDWALVNQAAADWARSYSTLLAGQINATSRGTIASTIRNSVASFFEEGLTMGELEARLAADPNLAKLFTKDVKDRLGRIYGPNRASLIAQTEVTRAAVEGERSVVQELAREGIGMKPIFNTSNDELVCPICSPRNQKEITDGQYPPLHPRCRCWVNYTFLEDSNA